jgi:hypothetical protein
MRAALQSTIFDSPVRIFPLGFKSKLVGENKVILDDLPGKTAVGRAFSSETAELLSSLSPSRKVACSSAVEVGIYGALAKAGLVQIEPGSKSLSQIELVVVIRTSSILKRSDAGTLSVRLENGTEFAISPIAVVWLKKNSEMSGANIAAVTQATRDELWGDPEDYEYVSKSAQHLGLDEVAFFEEQIFDLLGHIVRSGLGSIERPAAS